MKANLPWDCKGFPMSLFLCHVIFIGVIIWVLQYSLSSLQVDPKLSPLEQQCLQMRPGVATKRHWICKKEFFCTNSWEFHLCLKISYTNQDRDFRDKFHKWQEYVWTLDGVHRRGPLFLVWPPEKAQFQEKNPLKKALLSISGRMAADCVFFYKKKNKDKLA